MCTIVHSAQLMFGHLGWFQFLQIQIMLQQVSPYMLYFRTFGGTTSGKISRHRIAGWRYKHIHSSWVMPNAPPLGLYHAAFPAAINRSACFPTASPTGYNAKLLHFLSLFKWKVVSQCNFNLHFSYYKTSWRSFHRFEGHVLLFRELGFHDFCLFLEDFLPFFKSSLHIRDVRSSPVVCIAHIFSQSVTLLLTSLLLLLTIQILFE